MMYDAAIIGGGPAGAAAAIVLARAGLSAVVLERDRFPRFHIGESLLPKHHGLYQRLGLLEILEKEGFVPKYGAQFVSNDGSVERAFDFFTGRPDPGMVAWEVERERFDQILLDHAARCGAEVRHGVNVLAVDASAEHPCRLRLRREDGQEESLEARAVVDASGQGSLLAKAHGLRVNHPTHRKIAVFTRYRGAGRRTGRQAGNIDLVLGPGGWFWLIPLRNDLMSVGFVAATAAWKETGLPPEAFLERAIERSPYVTRRLRGAARVEQVWTASDYSYSSTRLSGPGFVLVGDAAEFLDPVFSTGVMLALRGGERAAEDLARALKADRPVGEEVFADYERAFRTWTRNHFAMIDAFYAPGFGAVFLNPKNTLGVYDAVVALLAGQSEPGLLDRLRLRFFYWLIKANLKWGFVKDPRPAEAAVPHG